MTRGFSRSIWMFMIRKVRKNLPWSLVLHTCRTQAIALHTSANTRLICRPHRRGRLHQKMIIRLRQRTASHGVAAGHGVAAPPVAMSKPRMSLMTTRWTPLVLLPKQRTQSPLATWGAVKRRCTIFLVKLKTAPTTTARQKVRVSPARPPRLLFPRFAAHEEDDPPVLSMLLKEKVYKLVERWMGEVNTAWYINLLAVSPDELARGI